MTDVVERSSPDLRRITDLQRVTDLQRIKHWFLISGSRRLVTFLLLVGVASSLVALDFVWPVEFRTLLTEQQTVQALFQTLLSGIILLVSIVVSINSQVVSQELTPIGNQHERVVESWNFRTETARTVGTEVTPAAPDEFLRKLIDAILADFDDLSDELDADSTEAEEDIVEYAEDTVHYLRKAQDILDESRYGSLDTRLFSPLYDPTGGLESAHRLRQRNVISEGVEESLEEVIEALQYFVTAREYFKTIYYKREFSRLSRDLLYTSIPSILLMTYVILAIDAQVFPGMTLGVPNLTLFFSGAYVVALLPFFVLTSYVLRAAVIAEQTVTAGAFNVQ